MEDELAEKSLLPSHTGQMWSACLHSEKMLGTAKFFYEGAGVVLAPRRVSPGSKLTPPRHVESQETLLWHNANVPIWVLGPWVKRQGGCWT